MRVPLSDIEVSRPRSTLGDLYPLMASIRKQGLIHPVLVRLHEGHLRLISGCRRMEAIRKIGMDSVPITIVTEAKTALSVLATEDAGPYQLPLRWTDKLRIHEEIRALKADPNWDARGQDVIAVALGTSRTTLRRVREVVELAEGNKQISELLTLMDETGKVTGPWNEARRLAGLEVEARVGRPMLARQQADRRAEVKRLYELNWRPQKIAKELGMSPSTVNNDLNALGFVDRKGRESAKSNSTEIMERIIPQLAGTTLALGKVEPTDIRASAEEAAQWENDLRRFRAALSPIYKAIKQIKEGT